MQAQLHPRGRVYPALKATVRVQNSQPRFEELHTSHRDIQSLAEQAELSFFAFSCSMWRSCGRRSRVMSFAFCWEWDAGNIVSCQASLGWQALLVQTKLEGWATRQSRAMWSTEFVSGGEAARSLCTRYTTSTSEILKQGFVICQGNAQVSAIPAGFAMYFLQIYQY